MIYFSKNLILFKKNLKRYAPLLVIMSLLSIVVMISFYYLLQPEKKLPIYSPNMVATELVDESIQFVKKYHRIADFKLINQNGDSITNDFYKNKIYVADFFFTTCPTICPIMTENMSSNYECFRKSKKRKRRQEKKMTNRTN